MALLAYQQVGSYTGAMPSFTAPSTSDTIAPDEHGYLWYKNTDASTEVITVVVPGTTFGQANPDIAVTIAATTGEEVIGPLARELADPTTGLITITMASTTGITLAAIRA